jgi:hypothetical protein
MKYNKITNTESALNLLGGTSLKDRLVGFNYKQLVAAFGEPTFSTPSGDGKVQKEWVFQRVSDGTIFTVYDWKTFDDSFTTTMNQTWNVGSEVYAGEFVTDMIAELKRKN